MAVMAREESTDERLDDLNRRVDEGFKEMRTEFRAVRSETQQEFQAVRSEMKDQTRLMIQLFGGMFATFAVGFIGIVVTILTQT
jgi:L-alanine-DL-glutamate epimerase-like enolase superfamily enzyme